MNKTTDEIARRIINKGSQSAFPFDPKEQHFEVAFQRTDLYEILTRELTDFKNDMLNEVILTIRNEIKSTFIDVKNAIIDK